MLHIFLMIQLSFAKPPLDSCANEASYFLGTATDRTDCEKMARQDCAPCETRNQRRLCAIKRTDKCVSFMEEDWNSQKQEAPQYEFSDSCARGASYLYLTVTSVQGCWDIAEKDCAACQDFYKVHECKMSRSQKCIAQHIQLFENRPSKNQSSWYLPWSSSPITTVSFSDDSTFYDNGFPKSGTVTFPDVVLKGQFYDNGRLKAGTVKTSDGQSLEGEFNEDWEIQSGTVKTSDGTVFEGEFYEVEGTRLNLKSGTKSFPSGIVHEGEFYESNGRIKSGTVTQPHAVAEGEFYEGTNGSLKSGTLTWVDETVAEGEFYEGNGNLKSGTITWLDGRVNEGEFYENGDMKLGTKTMTDGTVQIWEDGVHVRDKWFFECSSSSSPSSFIMLLISIFGMRTIRKD